VFFQKSPVSHQKSLDMSHVKRAVCFFKKKSCCISKETRVLLKESIFMSKESCVLLKESCVHSKESCFISKETCVHSKESCFISKGTCVHSKESCFISKETCFHSKESYFMSKGPLCIKCIVSSRGGGLGSSTIFKKFNKPYAPS